MKKLFYLIFVLIISFFFGFNISDEKISQNSEANTPESLGISSKAILDFIEVTETSRPNEMHSFMILRHGKEVAGGWWDPYDSESPHMLYSLSKSFTSTAIGLAQSEGLLTIDDLVISFFPEETPENPSKKLKSMRIRDLLKMNTGHNEDATSRMTRNSESWVKGFLALEVEHKPGTHFVYNSGATFMLSAIVQKVSGKTLEEYLTPRIFEPLGITSHRWEKNVNGINTGGWGLNIRTRDIANFGQLYLQKGEWNGKQLIPKEWVEEATSFQTSNGSNPISDSEQGYGYQFWMCRNNAYRGSGAFGQFCIVLPDQDAVIAITSGTKNMQVILNLVWDYLLPAFQNETLVEDPAAQKALSEKLANLKLIPVEGLEKSSISKKISGKSFKIEANEWGLDNITFNLKIKEKSVTFKSADSIYTLPIGFGEYKEGYYNFPQIGKQSVATSGAWIDGDTLELQMFLDETPYGYTNKVYFKDNQMTMTRELNVFFGETKREDLVGKIIE